MHRTAPIALIVLATTLSLVAPAAAQSSSAEVTPPIGLVDASGQAQSGTAVLYDGSASLASSVTQGSIDVWRKRIPCFDRHPNACVESSSTTDQGQIDVSGGTVSVTPRDGDTHPVTGLLARQSTDIRFQLADGSLELRGEDEVVPLSGDREAPQGMRQVQLPRGANLQMPSGGNLTIEGGFDLVSYDSVITVQSNRSDGSERLVTGWTWERGEDGVQWYHELTLVRARLNGAMVAPWDGPVDLAAQLPLSFQADQATVDVHDGSLGNATADSGNTTLDDVEATVTGIKWNPQASASTGPSSSAWQHHAQAGEGSEGWFLVEMGVEATPQPDPQPQDSVSTTTVVSAGSAALLTAALAAYYWPRLSWLGTVAVLPLYSRIEKDELFENEVRETLYELIQDDPGIHAHALAEGADVGWGTTVYHLRRLERNGFVTSEKRGRYRRFFPAAGFMARQREVLSVLQNETTNDIARLVLREPGLNQKAICEELDISPSLANWHLNRLLDAELVERERQGRTVHYTPGAAWQEVKDAVDFEVDEAALDEAVPAG